MTSQPTNGSEENGESEESGLPAFSFKDKRKVNPEGTVMGESSRNDAAAEEPAQDEATPVAAASEAVDPIDAEAENLVSEDLDALETKIGSLETELKRAQADYVNSRRRLERQAADALTLGEENVLTSLIPVLDELALARQHDELKEGSPFASMATKLEETLERHGLERYGAVGDEFDPEIHEALMHTPSEEVDVNRVQQVAQPGYKVNDKVLRAARVLVHGPES